MGSQVKETQSMMVVCRAGHEVTGHIWAALTSAVREQRAMMAGSHSALFLLFIIWNPSLWKSATIFRVGLPIPMNPI